MSVVQKGWTKKGSTRKVEYSEAEMSLEQSEEGDCIELTFTREDKREQIEVLRARLTQQELDRIVEARKMLVSGEVQEDADADEDGDEDDGDLDDLDDLDDVLGEGDDDDLDEDDDLDLEEDEEEDGDTESARASASGGD